MIHNHPKMETIKAIDEGHVIVDKGDYEEALEVQKRMDDLEFKMKEIAGKIRVIGKILKELES